MPDLASVNPFSAGGVGIGAIGFGLLILFGAIVIVLLFGLGLFLWLNNKKLKYSIPLLKKIGGRVIKVGIFKAKDFKISSAGDKLWFVPKARKYIPCGTLQTAPNEYTHFEREDGEWINIDYPDIDANMKQAKVKYVQSDMRSQRIAISNLLEQRFKGKQSWWEKYGAMVTQVIFYLVVAVSMVIIFYQWSGITEKVGLLFDRIVAYEQLKCAETTGVVPAFLPLIFLRRKRCQ